MSETIVFFGSGPVAAKSLRLLAEDFEIEAVITKSQPAHHKEAFPVLEVAKILGLKTFTPANKQELSDLFKNNPVKSRLGIVIDYGIIIAQDVIDYFPLGIVNSHFSLLPRWRGADPITFTILSGDQEGGISLMLIVEALDEGPLLAQAPYAVPANITTPELTDDLIDLSYRTLAVILPKYLAGEAQPVPQNESQEITYSRKLTKNDGLIDWSKPAEQIEREIRAFLEWPKSRTKFGDKEVIITKAHVVPGINPELKPGDIEASLLEDNILMVETASGKLCIDRLKPAGKKEMSAAEFLRGYKLG
ncbi:MAG TPA: methionyl-tRNA formyltransferase [Candidatus Saccharimonadales bacterium]|nr:methionyl-tRNA formyltransferase [Candidatus Saccharimonadales bacterium]